MVFCEKRLLKYFVLFFILLAIDRNFYRHIDSSETLIFPLNYGLEAVLLYIQ